MAVTISSSSIQGIDALYPVAGVDNDSQGFRDNFNIIKTQLGNAATDLSALDTNTAKLNANNDFSGNDISDANFIKNTEEVNNIGGISSSQNINWTDGNYQTLTAENNITLSLTGWGASGKLCKLRLQIVSTGSQDITFNAVGGTLKKDGNFPATFTINSSTNPKFVDFWTSNAGQTVFAQYVGEFGA